MPSSLNSCSIGGSENYGRGIDPNPWVSQMPEYQRRHEQMQLRQLLTRKIEMLTEPRFITCGETSELMESLITMIGAKSILELGMHTGIMLPSPMQLDCKEEWGEGYPNTCNPGLAILIRK